MISNLMNAQKTNNPSHKYKMTLITKLLINVILFAMPSRSVADAKSRMSKACSTENVLSSWR